MTNEEIARFFNDSRAFIQGNPNLRDSQVEGWFRTSQHFRNKIEYRILPKVAFESASRKKRLFHLSGVRVWMRHCIELQGDNPCTSCCLRLIPS